jgi:hypothetical protein
VLPLLRVGPQRHCRRGLVFFIDGRFTEGSGSAGKYIEISREPAA